MDDLQIPSSEIRRLYPQLSDAELVEAENNLNAYIELAVGMYARIQKDSEAYAKFKAEIVAAKDKGIV